MQNVTLITPAGRGSRAGNRATANRWAGLLKALGCRVQILGPDDPPRPASPPDLILILHAWRCHAALLAWRQAFPQCPLVLVLTGTDVYRFQHSHAQTVYESMSQADALIGLHDCLYEDIPERFHARLHIVHQSALPLPPKAPAPGQFHFDVLVAGHLREEKDSLRAAYAVRDLPAESRIRVTQMGAAHTPDWARDAESEMQHNKRYRWLGDRPHWQVRQWMSKARLMVMSSRMEGGANVVSEACVAGLPIIASRIPGNRGLLGEDYAGYYPVEDTRALRACLLQSEREPTYLALLRQQVKARAPLFRPEAEREGLAKVMQSLGVLPHG